jgi:23S rRNA pseudouridine2605 synthase
MSSLRLQKVLAQAGVASRRAAEELITEGRVRVNGRIVRELGTRADPRKDRVEVDGKRLVAQRHVYFLLHKPRGVVTTLDDPEGRKTVKDLLRDVRERVFPVGRLDFQTSGALLLTNDGELAQALLHPTRAVPKTYNAKLQGKIDEARLEALRTGVVLDDGKKTAPAEVSIIRRDDKATSLEITIAEGKNRQIHRMGEAIGSTVLRLTRISFAGLTLEGLRPGQMRSLSPSELTDLKQDYLQRAQRPKRRHPMHAYNDSDFGEAAPFLGSESEQTEAEPRGWDKPKRAPGERTQRAPAERTQRARRPAPTPARGQRNARTDQPRGQRDERTSKARTDRSRPSKTKRVQTPRRKSTFKR